MLARNSFSSQIHFLLRFPHSFLPYGMTEGLECAYLLSPVTTFPQEVTGLIQAYKL